MSETPAVVIRRAAALMRARAEAAPPGPWRAKAGHLGGSPHYVIDAEEHTAAECWGGSEEATSAHIAAWSPPVALAVADWLEGAAEAYDAFPGSVPGHSLKVALACLGEPAADAEAGIEAVKRDGREPDPAEVGELADLMDAEMERRGRGQFGLYPACARIALRWFRDKQQREGAAS